MHLSRAGPWVEAEAGKHAGCCHLEAALHTSSPEDPEPPEVGSDAGGRAVGLPRVAESEQGPSSFPGYQLVLSWADWFSAVWP